MEEAIEMRTEEEVRAELERIEKRIGDNKFKEDNPLYQHTLGYKKGLKFALEEMTDIKMVVFNLQK